MNKLTLEELVDRLELMIEDGAELGAAQIHLSTKYNFDPDELRNAYEDRQNNQ